MTKRQALRLARSRGWAAWRWLDSLAQGNPEVNHPFDYLYEVEVEAVELTCEDLADIVRKGDY